MAVKIRCKKCIKRIFRTSESDSNIEQPYDAELCDGCNQEELANAAELLGLEK